MRWPESNIKIFSRRNFRIIRIWWFGKLNYAKRVKKRMSGQIFRDLQNLTPQYLEKYVEKYGDESLFLLDKHFDNFLEKK